MEISDICISAERPILNSREADTDRGTEVNNTMDMLVEVHKDGTPPM